MNLYVFNMVVGIITVVCSNSKPPGPQIPNQNTFVDAFAKNNPDILLMEEILQHLGCIKPCK